MKPHLPIPLLAVLVSAIAAPCALADTYENVTYTAAATSPAIVHSDVTIDANASTTNGAPTNSSTLNLANYTGTLTLKGSATGNQSILLTASLGGYGGRFHLTGTSTDANFTISLSGGTEVDMGSVLASSTNAPALTVNNASFFVNNDSTIYSDIRIDGTGTTGGLRLNGNLNGSYTFSGAITGSGWFATNLGGTGTLTFTGDVSGYEGRWIAGANGRTLKFGNGEACTGGSIGGYIGRTENKVNVEFNYSGDYTIKKSALVTTLTIAGGNATFQETVSATTLAIASGSTAAFSAAVTATTVNINGNADFSRGLTATTLNVNSAATISGTVTATTLNIASDATFSGTVSAGTVTVADGASFSLTDTGVYALNGKTVAGLTVGGTGTISLSGTNTFHGTLTAQGSTISIADNAVFSSDALALLDTVGGTAISYRDELDPHSGNGYAASNTFLLIANSSNTENRTLSNQMEGDLAGTTLKLVSGIGLVAQTPGTGGAYYINNGTVTYGASGNSTASPDTEELILNSGCTLVFQTALPEGKNLTAHGGTITVNEGGSLAASQVTATAATTLTGNGNYKVTSNSLGANIHLKTGAEGWKGTVTLSDFSSTNSQDFSNLVNGEHSTLELNGFTGWTNHWAHAVYGNETINFKLTDNGSAAAWTNGATASTAYTCNFTGEFSGTGTFKVTGQNQHYTFSGNISKWEGTFKKDSTRGTTNLTFTGNATNVNVAITKESGTLNVVAGVDGITFSKAITATSLAVNANVNATLNGTATVDTLTLNGGATATLSGEGKVATGGGKISFEALNKASASPIATLQAGEAGETPAAAATGTITNGGNTAASFSSSAAGTADTTYTNIKVVTTSSAANFELLGTLNSSAVVNNGTGAITVTASGAQDGLYANSGNITVNTADATVALRELSIAAGKTVSAHTATSIAEGATLPQTTLSVSEVASFGAGAAVDANLELQSGVTLALGGALTLTEGSTLTLHEGMKLGGGILAELQALTLGGKVDLFTGVGDLILGSNTAPASYAMGTGAISSDISMTDEVDLGTYFSNVQAGNYFLVYDSGTGTISAVVPEPATATLGLLALAGLCARRRRQ